MTDRDVVSRDLFINMRCGGACLRAAAPGGRETARARESVVRSEAEDHRQGESPALAYNRTSSGDEAGEA
ncbi:hypothetical protein DJ83_16685 [Halorubrum ezzemoulense]|uniref:Uncharacterized protein n=1 Tax=Halorubrum ezzemoulense TaxID=337243 RepID=A0A256IME7_HALEZ|nr:hypothetical protein DJ83_16685 [Halorubrum ezzemoulense]